MAKILIIGLDGVTFKLLDPWIKEEYLPTFKKLKDKGCYAYLKSCLPTVTPTAWTSITTGKNPGKHGIFDFQKIDFNYNSKIYLSNDKRSYEIWDYLIDKKSIIINLPYSYPPKRINGIMMSGMLTPDKTSNFIIPSKFKKDILDKFPDYSFELDWILYRGRINRFKEDLMALTDKRIKLFYYFIEKEWDFYFFVFIEPDRAQHILWSDLSLKKYFKYIDYKLNEILKKIERKKINLFLISDHGFARVYKKIHINDFLKNEGYLALKSKKSIKKLIGKIKTISENILKFLSSFSILQKILNYIPMELIKYTVKPLLENGSNFCEDIDWKNTKVFMYGTGQILINTKNRFAEGIVSDEEYEDLRQHIKNKLESLKDPETGKKVIHKVFKKEEIYSGKFLKDGPDLIIFPQKGYIVSATLKGAIFEKLDFKRGDHDLDGIFIGYGPDIKSGYNLGEISIFDIAPTILYMLGSPIPREMDGRVLKEIFKNNSKLSKRKINYQEEIKTRKEKERIKRIIKNLDKNKII